MKTARDEQLGTGGENLSLINQDVPGHMPRGGSTSCSALPPYPLNRGGTINYEKVGFARSNVTHSPFRVRCLLFLGLSILFSLRRSSSGGGEKNSARTGSEFSSKANYLV